MSTSTIQNGPFNLNTYRLTNVTTLQESGQPVYGWVTGDKKALNLYIMTKGLPHGLSSVPVTALTMTGRKSTGGYIGGSENYNAFSDSTDAGSYNSASVIGRFIRVILTKKDSGTWDSNNNIYFTGYVAYTMELE